MKKLFIVFVIVAGVVALSVLNREQASSSADEVIGFEVISGPIESTVLATGTLTYGDERRVRSELNARVEKLTIEEGDEVALNQVLVELERDDYETDVSNQETNVSLRKIDIERAELQIESLNIQLARQQKLFDQNAAQASTLDDLRNQIAQAEVNLKMQMALLNQSEDHLQQATKRLAKTVIRSPMAGLVSALDLKEGELAVATGADVPLLTLVDPTQIFSEVDVDEADIGNVEVGQPVRVFAVAYLDTPLDGKVTKIATSARQVPGKNSLVFPVEVQIAPQNEVTLRPGMSTRAEILNRSEADYAIVPIEAIQEGEQETDGYHVFVFVDGIAQKKTVKLGPQDDRYQAVTSGVAASDVVITGPYRILRTLKDGDAIALSDNDDSADQS